MAQTIINLLGEALTANTNEKFRRGNLIHLPDNGSVVVAGDIHGHRRNFERILAYVELENNPDRHLILQEIIHGGPEDQHGDCLSYQLLFEAIRYKLKFPDQIHFIMGNHDTAFINNSKVMKNGKEMNVSMRSAMQKQFGSSIEEIDLALRQYLFSQPLAIRCQNRIWMSHSLPADRYADKFDTNVLDKTLKINDVVRPGAAYVLTWGRRHSQELLDKMAKLLDVDIFILGHQPQKQGWKQAGNNLLILASDHSHGCLLDIDLAKPYTVDELIDTIVPLAAII